MSSLRETWRQMHTIQFWVVVLAVCAWIALGAWLHMLIHWPESYGFHCHGRGCLMVELWHSPALLRTHSLAECGMFLWLWSMPAFVVTVLILAKLRKRGGGGRVGDSE